MSLIGLAAWMCLLVSGFAHLSTFFEGGATLSGVSLGVMGSLALILWYSAWRQRKLDRRPWRLAFPLSSLVITVTLALYAGATTHNVRAQLEAGNFLKTEEPERLKARAWTGLWLLIFVGPVLFYSRRPLELQGED